MRAQPSKVKKPSHFEIQGQFFVAKEVSPLRFSWSLGIVFALIALWNFSRGKSEWIWISFAVLSALFPLMGHFFQESLKPFQRFWFKVGYFLEKINNPLWMGILYFLVFTPLGLMLRILKRDFFYKRFRNPSLNSYWTQRPKEDFTESFPLQF